MAIHLPHDFTARAYQAPLFNCLANGFRRAVAVWHRRSGKDKTALNLTIKEMEKRVGVYYYFLPTFNEGRRVIWDGIGADGMKFMDHFPHDFIDGEPNKTEMKVKAANGSLFQIIGTDHFDRIRGPNPVGCVFSEYSLQDPRAWDVVRPILAENNGWAIFLYTPKGANHGKDLYDMAESNPDWFNEILTVNDTRRDDGTPVITEEAIQAERDSGMPEDMIEQEFFCSFLGGVVGAYYAELMNRARLDERIRVVPHDPSLPVHTGWDIGYDDSNAIWFFQLVGPWANLIDYVEDRQKTLDYYMGVLKDKRQELGYNYQDFFLPHDIEGHDLSQREGLSRREVLERDWRVKITTIPRIATQMDGITAVRRFLPRAYFDEKRCAEGIKSLDNYRKEWDEKRKVYRNYPLHDWASHGAKAMESVAIGVQGGLKYEPLLGRKTPDKVKSERVQIMGKNARRGDRERRADYGFRS